MSSKVFQSNKIINKQYSPHYIPTKNFWYIIYVYWEGWIINQLACLMNTFCLFLTLLFRHFFSWHSISNICLNSRIFVRPFYGLSDDNRFIKIHNASKPYLFWIPPRDSHILFADKPSKNTRKYELLNARSSHVFLQQA